VANMNPRVGMVRLFLGSLGAFSLITLFLVAPAGAASGKLGREVVLLRSPALVKAVLRNNDDSDWGFEIQIAHAGKTESVLTGVIGERTYSDAVSHLRKAVAWRPPYLFVVSECGGGNVWSCAIEHVFKIQGGRFQKVGLFIGGERTGAAESYEHGYFMDTYDKLEDMDGLSHAGSPDFYVALRERDGRFAVDLAETWRLNRQEVLDTLAKRWPQLPPPAKSPIPCDQLAAINMSPPKDPAIAQVLRPCDPPPDEGESRVSPLANALAIALYCGKKDVAGQIAAKAARILRPKDLRTIREVKKRVRPGELPSRWRGRDFGRMSFDN
jgi:hypothetical protein